MHSSECLFFEIRWRGIWWMNNSRLRASSHESGWPGWPGCRDDFTLYSYQKFQPGFRDEKGQKSWRLVLARNWRNKANMMEQKLITFVTIMALATFKAVSLQSNGMLMKWKILQAMREDAIRLSRIHQAFIPVTGLKCSYAKISSPPSHMNTSKLLQRI